MDGLTEQEIADKVGYKTASERTTVTLESVGEIDTVLVSGVNGTLYQFYQVK